MAVGASKLFKGLTRLLNQVSKVVIRLLEDEFVVGVITCDKTSDKGEAELVAGKVNTIRHINKDTAKINEVIRVFIAHLHGFSINR